MYNPDLKEKYEDKINDRKELVESSDVASWLSSSSSTVTGKIIRVCALVISIFICASSLYLLYRLLLQDMGYLLEVLQHEINARVPFLYLDIKTNLTHIIYIKTICVRLL